MAYADLTAATVAAAARAVPARMSREGRRSILRDHPGTIAPPIAPRASKAVTVRWSDRELYRAPVWHAPKDAKASAKATTPRKSRAPKVTAPKLAVTVVPKDVRREAYRVAAATGEATE